MIAFSEIEALVLLCFYKYDKAKDIDSFLECFIEYFNKDIGKQTLLYELSVIESAEKSANKTPTEKRIFYRNLWEKYGSSARANETRDLYQHFREKKYLIKRESISEVIQMPEELVVSDKPVQKTNIHEDVKTRQQRSYLIRLQALAAANYRCECDCGRTLFLRRGSNHYYTEGHHLIPICFQPDFEFSLDVPSNIVSLCPSCHRQLHYGNNVEHMIEYLWKKRNERLIRCGIGIDYLDLLLMYR